MSHTGDIVVYLQTALDRQRDDYLEKGPDSAAVRVGRIDRLLAILDRHGGALVEAMSADFGHRSTIQSILTDILGIKGPIKQTRNHVRSWMKPERRSSGLPFSLFGAKAWIEYQPLGVVGVISPWNFPVTLALQPLAQILAAGNRAMIKLSEFTPKTSELLAEILHDSFDETEVYAVTGGPEVGAVFSQLKFDHLFFTGATSIGKKVMQAAAANLVPVTLELGGKSPAIIGKKANLRNAVLKIAAGKTLNAGQICLAPDYVFIPKQLLEAFVSEFTDAIGQMYPNLIDNDDYTSIISARHHQRLSDYVNQARSYGMQVVQINPAKENFNCYNGTKFPPTLVIDPGEGLAVMEDEIFGPILPIKTYESLEDVIAYINRRPRPLGLYFFGKDKKEQRQVIERTTSGGVTLNDVILHAAVEALPFGGVGESGIGAYHGRTGFLTFSHAKAIFKAPWVDLGQFIRPPYGERMQKMLRSRL